VAKLGVWLVWLEGVEQGAGSGGADGVVQA